MVDATMRPKTVVRSTDAKLMLTAIGHMRNKGRSERNDVKCRHGDHLCAVLTAIDYHLYLAQE